LTDKTILVSIIARTYGIGVLQPIAEIGKIATGAAVLFPHDGVAGRGKIPMDVNKMNIDLMSLTAHKIYGQGVGALYVRRKNPRVQVSLIDAAATSAACARARSTFRAYVGLGKSLRDLHE